MNRNIVTSRFGRLACVVLVAVALVSCKKALDFSKYSEQATAIAQKYAPQLQELSGKLPDLLKRAGDIPDSVPGATALKGLLAKNQDAATQLQGLIAGLTDKVTSSVKTGKPEEVQKTIDTETAKIDSGITTLKTDMDAATADLTKAEDAAKAAPAATAAPVAPAAGDFSRKLASGVEIKGAADGVESKLIAFIEDATKAVDKNTWFTFDRLTFQTGKAELDLDKSKDQLANISEILKAFPAVKLKIGGYTDNVGKPADNKKLSLQRAQAVVAALVAGGAAKDRAEAEGYGSEHPVCAANDTEDCKAKNRRIDVSVRAK
jgi:outer membrane protein OmpA-like peptidoglycan-associated protein